MFIIQSEDFVDAQPEFQHGCSGKSQILWGGISVCQPRYLNKGVTQIVLHT